MYAFFVSYKVVRGGGGKGGGAGILLWDYFSPCFWFFAFCSTISLASSVHTNFQNDFSFVSYLRRERERETVSESEWDLFDLRFMILMYRQKFLMASGGVLVLCQEKRFVVFLLRNNKHPAKERSPSFIFILSLFANPFPKYLPAVLSLVPNAS